MTFHERLSGEMWRQVTAMVRRVTRENDALRARLTVAERKLEAVRELLK